MLNGHLLRKLKAKLFVYVFVYWSILVSVSVMVNFRSFVLAIKKFSSLNYFHSDRNVFQLIKSK